MGISKQAIQEFPHATLPREVAEELSLMCNKARGDVLTMTTLAKSGHPGGSLSSMEMYMMAYGVADITPDNCDGLERDFVVIDHGHTSPGAYAVLGAWGFVNVAEAVAHFRQCGSCFSGHVERSVPGIDWGTGNLGQGLAAAVGYALALRSREIDKRVYLLMGDGGQVKGQVAEARRIASKEKLHNITVLVDYNNIQISGTLDQIMPFDIRKLWEADGWEVTECDGHDLPVLYGALREAAASPAPRVILCRTVMGKGVSFMENTPEYHGKTLSLEQYTKAMEELGFSPNIEDAARRRSQGPLPKGRAIPRYALHIDPGTPKVYGASEKTDNRSAFGNALKDLGKNNAHAGKNTPILVFDCDLAGSVKTSGFAKEAPENFIQTGIQEHATATVSGAASAGGTVALWADFGVFGIGETYNQQRLNDCNQANLKLGLTHVGLDVGEDGMTHQSIDYVGLFRNFFGWKLIVPADPNQTDRATRYALGTWGNICLAMGRSKLPVITREDGTPFYDASYRFEYGALDLLREGNAGTLFCMGHMAWRALKAWEILKEKGLSVRVVHVPCPLAIPDEDLRRYASSGGVLTYEDHSLYTGLGSIMALKLLSLGLTPSFAALGVSRLGESGTAEEVMAEMELTPEDVAERFAALLKV
ncbi:MAG TPA: transketolase [Synergistaceae bacterium]|nr:transketolase [Synergistaceae bacterium]HPQ37532.1 transketolase [Synergistaceae bacterium]